jgi:hypothetical protein
MGERPEPEVYNHVGDYGGTLRSQSFINPMLDYGCMLMHPGVKGPARSLTRYRASEPETDQARVPGADSALLAKPCFAPRQLPLGISPEDVRPDSCLRLDSCLAAPYTGTIPVRQSLIVRPEVIRPGKCPRWAGTDSDPSWQDSCLDFQVQVHRHPEHVCSDGVTCSVRFVLSY